MFLLKKAFDLRDKAGNSDKPFLEHLEDLRFVITRVVVTLLIGTLLCYAFKDTLMDLLRRPIEVVWEQSQKERLPAALSPDRWETAKLTSHHSSSLDPAAKELYFAQFDDVELPFYAECARYYRAAKSISSPEKQNLFIDSLPDVSDKVKSQTKDFLEMKPNSEVGAKNNVVYMRSLKPTETFMLSLKLAFFAGIIVSFPFILYFTLQFVLPGLKAEERKALWPALVAGFGLFLSGVFFCYFMVLPEALKFFYTYSASMGVENEWRIGDYITFATQFTLIFGLAFELPVIVMTLVKLNILDYEIMSRTRSYAIVSIFVIAAVITPTGDALTLSMLAAPMSILYEICIWLAYFSRKKELEKEAAEMAPHTSNSPVIEIDETDDTNTISDEDREYFQRDPEHQTEDEGEELDHGEHDRDLDSEEDVNSMLNQLRAAYDPNSSHDGDIDQEKDS